MQRIDIYLSPQALDLVAQLESFGLYGMTKNEVCQRIIEQALWDMVDPASKTLTLPKVKK